MSGNDRWPGEPGPSRSNFAVAGGGGTVQLMRAVVIGGGIAGVSAAHALSGARVDGRAVDVILVEAERVLAHHTTGRSAAQLILNYGVPPIRALTRASLDFLHHPPKSLVDHPLLEARDVLAVATAEQHESTDRFLAEGLATNPAIREITVAEARILFPPLRSDWAHRAVLESDSYDIDVAGLHQAFVRGVRANGGTIRLTAPVVGLERGPHRWEVSLADGERLAADVVVNAAGAWGDVVARRAGIAPVGLQPMRRTAFMTPSRHAGSAGWPLVADIDHNWYVKPDGSQLLCSPADEQPSEPCDAKPEEIDVALAIDRINTATTLDIRHVASSWAGLRTFTADRSMVIGPEPDDPSFVWCVGQGGTGIQTAPAAGRLVADLVVGGEPRGTLADVDLDLAGLLPDRLR